MNIHRSTLVCATALAASMSAAYAGPCSPEITRVRQVIAARIHAKAGAAHASESTAAKMHRQPTPRSIGAAEVAGGQTSPEEYNALNAAMARAVEADSAGNQSACEQALADAKRAMGLPSTQTDDARR
jgi:hypothetical protein